MVFDYEEKSRHYQRRFGMLRQKDYLPFELIDLIERVAFAQLDARRDAKVVIPSPEELADTESNLQGKPLLPREEFGWDEFQAKQLFIDLLAMLGKQKGPMADAAAMVQASLDSGELEPSLALADFVRGRNDLFTEWEKKTPDAPRTLVFLTQAALTPSVEALAGELAKSLSKDRSRPHGVCPVCGSLPLFTDLRDKEGRRFATCSFCRTEYRIRRLACPLCDEDRPDRLHFYDVKEERGFRVDACDSCKMYIKGSDFRTLDKISVPVLDDLESLPLDFLAMEKGFSRPTMSAWGF